MPQARRKQISSHATKSSWCLVVLQPPDGDWCSSAGTFLSLTYLLLRTFTCFQSLLESILMSVLKTLHCTSCSKKELTNEKTQLLVHHDNCILFEKSNPCLLESQDINDYCAGYCSHLYYDLFLFWRHGVDAVHTPWNRSWNFASN